VWMEQQVNILANQHRDSLWEIGVQCEDTRQSRHFTDVRKKVQISFEVSTVFE
jgi:hypothetical protein